MFLSQSHTNVIQLYTNNIQQGSEYDGMYNPHANYNRNRSDQYMQTNNYITHTVF